MSDYFGNPEFRYWFKFGWHDEIENCLVIEARDKIVPADGEAKDYYFACELERNEFTQKTIEWIYIGLQELFLKMKMENVCETFSMKDLAERETKKLNQYCPTKQLKK